MFNRCIKSVLMFLSATFTWRLRNLFQRLLGHWATLKPCNISFLLSSMELISGAFNCFAWFMRMCARSTSMNTRRRRSAMKRSEKEYIPLTLQIIYQLRKLCTDSANGWPTLVFFVVPYYWAEEKLKKRAWGSSFLVWEDEVVTMLRTMQQREDARAGGMLWKWRHLQLLFISSRREVW